MTAPVREHEPDEWIYEACEPAAALPVDGLSVLEQRVAPGLGQTLAGLLDARPRDRRRPRAAPLRARLRLVDRVHPRPLGLSDSRADQLIDSARTVAIVLPPVPSRPPSPKRSSASSGPSASNAASKPRDAWQQIVTGQ